MKFYLKKHLAEYLNGKYYCRERGCVVLPDMLDLYHTVWNLMQKRPMCSPVCLEGNVCLGLPDRRVGKDPAVYNYLSARSIKLIERCVEVLFFCEIRELMEENKRERYIQYIDSAYMFKAKYGIESITDDALIKDYYRYRERLRQRTKKRKYERKKNCPT